MANINNTTENTRICGVIFKTLLLGLTCDTDNSTDEIGFISYYKEGRTGYYLNVSGYKETGYKMETPVCEMGVNEMDAIIKLSRFQKELLRTVFNLEVKKALSTITNAMLSA